MKSLAVFFGIYNPAKNTFDHIYPKIVKSLTFWKSFYLSKMAKARVLEIFIASRLWYAARFYAIPAAFIKKVQTMFFDFINYPRPVATVSQQVLIKMRLDGGIKLVDVATKSSVSKCMWLIQLITNPALAMNISLATDLLGEENGHKTSIDIFFCPPKYASYNLRHIAPFFKEAISPFSQFDLQRHVTITDVPLQHYFYNRVFVDEDYKAIINPLSGKKRASCISNFSRRT